MFDKHLNVIAKKWTLYFILVVFIITCGNSWGFGAGIAWDSANAVGYAAFVSLLVTCFSRPVRLNMISHRNLGYITLLFTSLHVSILLITDPLTIEYLKPKAPLYMWLGTFSAIFMVCIIISSITRYKSSFYHNTTGFKKVHKVSSWLVMVGCLYHIIDSGLFVHQPWQILTLIFITLFSLWSVNIKKLPPINHYIWVLMLILFIITLIALWSWPL